MQAIAFHGGGTGGGAWCSSEAMAVMGGRVRLCKSPLPQRITSDHVDLFQCAPRALSSANSMRGILPRDSATGGHSAMIGPI
jgi:hypothetical protein